MAIDVRDVTSYADLLTLFQPRLICGQVEAARVARLIDDLTDLQVLSEGQQEFVGLLGQLLYDWELVREQLVEVSPQEIVQSLLEDNGLHWQDLVGEVLPSSSAVSDFLAGCHPLSYELVAKLAAFFHVSPAAFYPVYEPC